MVNNNAAATLLLLAATARGKGVVLSRGELVEIGGSFRIPEVMRESGALLIEVGTTNRTHLRDYAAAIDETTGMILKVHTSNYRIEGFTAEVEIEDLVALGRERGIPVAHDLGSGCAIDLASRGLPGEPLLRRSVAAGADLVCFSGDKLLGGPQAGILVGKSEVMARIAKHPLMRAVRIDKMTLAALEATLRHYQRNEAELHIPIWRMISARPERLASRATSWASKLQAQGISARTQRGESTVGGGSLPGETLPTTLLALDAARVPLPLDELAKRLRLRSTPIVTRILRDTLLLDPRTVLDEQDGEVVKGLGEELLF